MAVANGKWTEKRMRCHDLRGYLDTDRSYLGERIDPWGKDLDSGHAFPNHLHVNMFEGEV